MTPPAAVARYTQALQLCTHRTQVAGQTYSGDATGCLQRRRHSIACPVTSAINSKSLSRLSLSGWLLPRWLQPADRELTVRDAGHDRRAAIEPRPHDAQPVTSGVPQA